MIMLNTGSILVLLLLVGCFAWFAWWHLEQLRPSLRRWRPWLGATVLLAVLGGAGMVWLLVFEPMRKGFDWSRRVRADIRTLTAKRPPDVLRGQWEFMVGWTINLHANCGTIEGTAAWDSREAFADELHSRLQKPVDLATIDWIWDAYARFTTHGQSYSDKYRPTRSEDLQHARPGCFGLEVP